MTLIEKKRGKDTGKNFKVLVENSSFLGICFLR